MCGCVFFAGKFILFSTRNKDLICQITKYQLFTIVFLPKTDCGLMVADGDLLVVDSGLLVVNGGLLVVDGDFFWDFTDFSLISPIF